MQVGCPNGKNGKCNKGLHVCAYCHKPGHSVVNCRSKGSNRLGPRRTDSHPLASPLVAEPSPSATQCRGDERLNDLKRKLTTLRASHTALPIIAQDEPDGAGLSGSHQVASKGAGGRAIPCEATAPTQAAHTPFPASKFVAKEAANPCDTADPEATVPSCLQASRADQATMPITAREELDGARLVDLHRAASKGAAQLAAESVTTSHSLLATSNVAAKESAGPLESADPVTARPASHAFTFIAKERAFDNVIPGAIDVSLAEEAAKTSGVADPLAVKGALVQNQGASDAALQSTASVHPQDGGRSNFPVPKFSCGLGPSFSKGVKLGLQQGANTCKLSESTRPPALNEPEFPVPSATPLSHLPQTDDSQVGQLPPNNSFAGRCCRIP